MDKQALRERVWDRLDEAWRIDDHDVPLDLIATPDRLVRTGTRHARPGGVDFEALGDRIEAMPVLERLREERGRGRNPRTGRSRNP